MWTRLQLTCVRSVLMAAPLFALLLVWAGPAFPHAGNTNPTDIHACVNRVTNVVRIVGVNGHCRSRGEEGEHHGRERHFFVETAVHWPGVASASAAPPLRFIDGNRPAKVIGEAIDSFRAVIDLGNGALITVGLLRSGFEQSPAEALSYESLDCTGQGFLDADTASNFASVQGSIATFRDFSAVMPATLQSVFFPGFGCFAFDEPTPGLVARALTFDLSTLGLVPPFTLAK